MRANSRAFDQGIQVGSQYISRINIRETTMGEMGAVARQRAKDYYKTESKQQEFVQGWFALSQQFQTMFKDYPTKLTIMGVIFKCEHCKTTFEIESAEPTTLKDIRERQYKPCPICEDTGKVIKERLQDGSQDGFDDIA